jgi:malonate transporter and related proteins
MSNFLEILGFSFSITAPIFVILALGVWFTYLGWMNDNFIEVGSKLVFNVALPTLLFISISKTHISEVTNWTLIVYAAIGTVVIYLLLEVIAHYFIHPHEDRGVIIQGSFRSNMGIIGLAYCINAYGHAGLVAASLYLGLITILFNILSVITLNRSLHKNKGIGNTFMGIITNPLIIGIVLALPIAWTEVQLPELILDTGEYFAQMTLPLALLCTGGSLNFNALKCDLNKALFASACKLIIVPFLLTFGGYLLGFRGIDLGVLFLLSSAPTAAASYIMVRAMGGNAALAANIIVLTVIGSLFATSLGVTLLRGLDLM